MIKQECIGIPDMILLLMIFCFKKIKIKAEIVLSPGGAYFSRKCARLLQWVVFFLDTKGPLFVHLFNNLHNFKPQQLQPQKRPKRKEKTKQTSTTSKSH